MNNRQKNGFVCIFVSVILAGIAFNNTFISPDLPVTDASGLGVSRMVGAFLPAVLVMAAGFYFLQNQNLEQLYAAGFTNVGLVANSRANIASTTFVRARPYPSLFLSHDRD
jgi:hypothetical protein